MVDGLVNYKSTERKNKKRVILSKYNPYIFISAPLIDERCSYRKLAEITIIWKSRL
jgi:hypothetical protein